MSSATINYHAMIYTPHHYF